MSSIAARERIILANNNRRECSLVHFCVERILHGKDCEGRKKKKGSGRRWHSAIKNVKIHDRSRSSMFTSSFKDSSVPFAFFVSLHSLRSQREIYQHSSVIFLPRSFRSLAPSAAST